jgi:hypothetical protein
MKLSWKIMTILLVFLAYDKVFANESNVEILS